MDKETTTLLWEEYLKECENTKTKASPKDFDVWVQEQLEDVPESVYKEAAVEDAKRTLREAEASDCI